MGKKKITALFIVLMAAVLWVGVPTGGAQEAKKEKKDKVKTVETVVDYVGKRSIAYKHKNKKGKTKRGAVAVDENTYIERIKMTRERVALKDLHKGDKVIITYGAGPYDPVQAVQVVGKKGKSKKKK